MKYTALFFLSFLILPLGALADDYRLEIAPQKVEVDGVSTEKIGINGTTPGPILHFREGEEVSIDVTNHLQEDTSIHWHGLIVPGPMDGAPGLNGFPGIRPGETFHYQFKPRQSGTYWYHSHSLGQEQDGIHGAIVISPNKPDPIKADRDYVVLLSDFSRETSKEILGNLKMDGSYYSRNQRTLVDFLRDVKSKGVGPAFRFVRDWGEMRMSPSDLSDVTGYTFLINGKSPKANWTSIFKPGERVRLRFINAAAMSIFDVRIPGLKMAIVAADGQNVEPLSVDEFRFGVAETYDVIVTPPDEKAYSIVAEPIDRSGFAIGTLAPRDGMRGEEPPHRVRTTLTMADMGMSMDMSEMDHSQMSMEDMESGWAKAGTPPGDIALDYSNLKSLEKHTGAPEPTKEISLHLNGNMERYIWTINGKKMEEAEPIRLAYGEKVKLTYINDSMMAHPMHLHGMFVELENGQPAESRPYKHTVIIPPGTSRSVILTANEAGSWAFHCHLLYHMLSGMMTTVEVSRSDREAN